MSEETVAKGVAGAERVQPDGAVLTPLAAIAPEAVRWLWPGRIPLGKLSLLVGDPGLGKSWVTLDLAARVSTGHTLPDGAPCEAADVVILSAEDGPADTIRPRLDALGADVTRVHMLNMRAGNVERAFDLGADLNALAAVLRPGTRLLIIDPLSAYLGDVDSNKDAAVRHLLTPLTAFAATKKIAVLGVMHLNKAAVLDAIYRITGSVAFVAAARAAWVVAEDPQNRERRFFLPLKANLARADIGGLAFAIAERDGRPTLAWEPGKVDIAAREVLGGFRNTRRGPAAIKSDTAEALLLDVLSDGAEQASKPIIERAKALGVSYGTLQNVATGLGVRRRKSDLDGGWLWSLPEGRNGGAGNSQSSAGNSESSANRLSHMETLNLRAKSLSPNDFAEDSIPSGNSQPSKIESYLGDKQNPPQKERYTL